jgi:NADPH-dependent ferric siderophore reductase
MVRTTPVMYGAVEDVEQLTPQLVRVILGGDGLAPFVPDEWSDSYLNLLFVPPDAPYTVPFDPDGARKLDRARWPIPRRYTVRSWDPERRRLAIDFVVHGETGTAGRWALNAQPGDLLQFQGPGGGYRPDPHLGWHLLVGDESALPAIAASLEQVPAHATALVVGLVDGPDAELSLDCPGQLKIIWVHRNALPPGDSEAAGTDLVQAVAGLDFPSDGVHGFVHGEAVETRAVRRHLLGDRRMPRQALSVSPYWRRTFTDERWRSVKRDWLSEVERDV